MNPELMTEDEHARWCHMHSNAIHVRALVDGLWRSVPLSTLSPWVRDEMVKRWYAEGRIPSAAPAAAVPHPAEPRSDDEGSDEPSPTPTTSAHALRLAEQLARAVRVGALAVRKWGPGAQVDQLIEEAGETVSAAVHYKRGRVTLNRAAEEGLDVAVVAVGLLAGAHGEGEALAALTRHLRRQLDRLEDRVNDVPQF